MLKVIVNAKDPSVLGALRMTAEERKQVMEENPPVVTAAHNAAAYFDWEWHGCGFGQLSFDFDRKTQLWGCSNEGMDPDRVRTLLHAFADYVADNLKPVIEEEQLAWKNRQK